MTVFGRLGALFVVLGGVALLLVDGIRSPPGLWYAAASVAAGTTIVMYPVIASPSPRRPQPAPEPASPSTSDDSTTASTTRQTDSQPVDTEQTAESTESTKQEPEPASDDDPEPPEPPTPEGKPEPSSTAVKHPQRLPKKTQKTERTASHINSSRAKKTARTSTRRNRHVTATASPRRNSSTGADNPFFKPVDSSHEIKLVQVDTRFSYLDIDWGPEFIGLDPVPDLIEVDVGPSAVSQELVRSPVEIKISSFLKALLAPTPSSSDTAASDDSPRSSTETDNRDRHRADDARTGRQPSTIDVRETPYREQDRGVDRRRDPLAAFDERQQLPEARPQSSGREPMNRHKKIADTAGLGSREDLGTFDGGRSGDRRSPGLEPIMDEEPLGTQQLAVVDEPAVDVGMNYSPPQWEPPQWDTDPFGLTDIDPGFSGIEESVLEPVEPSELGFGMSDWEPDVSIEEPAMDPEIGAKMLGLDGFAEPPEGAVGLSSPDVENGSNQLFPEAESFFPEEDAEDDWLTF
jgi:hypothetical protein